MKIDYKFDENDFLTYQLFVVSKSEFIKRKRKKNNLILSLIFVVFGLLFLIQNKVPLTISFLIIGILWYFIYPLWEKRYYIKYYKGFINENYKDRFGRTATIEFTNDYILGIENGSESKIMTTEIEVINEIPTFIFIMLKGGHSLILAKNKIADSESLKVRLKELANHLQIKYDTDDKWEWE